MFWIEWRQAGKALAIASVLLFGAAYIGQYILQEEPAEPQRTAEEQTTETTIETLLDAIEWVESKGDVNAVGDSGEAIGAYQIHKIYVRDANRILGYDKFTYEDRWDRDKSRAMTSIVIQHYGDDIETMARSHKCPTKRYHESTKNYWYLVKKRLDNLQ